MKETYNSAHARTQKEGSLGRPEEIIPYLILDFSGRPQGAPTTDWRRHANKALGLPNPHVKDIPGGSPTSLKLYIICYILYIIYYILYIIYYILYIMYYILYIIYYILYIVYYILYIVYYIL